MSKWVAVLKITSPEFSLVVLTIALLITELDLN